MPGRPWWIDRVNKLPKAQSIQGLTVGALWNLLERIRFVRETVDAHLLEADFQALPECRGTWSALLEREHDVRHALAQATEELAQRVRKGALAPDGFRAAWEGLGFAPNAEGGGTPADDYLDGMLHLSRLTMGEAPPDCGMPNMASRAQRIADFLNATHPNQDDVVFDLGCGNGKVALTVAASTQAKVRGVEWGPAYVAAAQASAQFLGLSNVTFARADVRETDLSAGSIFYLYYPFHGGVARSVADTLGRLGRSKDITIYSSGPLNDYGEHFIAQVQTGALLLSERRGDFSEVMVLRSARA
jgi:23S rRNA (uracil1939-C5)-methyltransferase